MRLQKEVRGEARAHRHPMGKHTHPIMGEWRKVCEACWSGDGRKVGDGGIYQGRTGHTIFNFNDRLLVYHNATHFANWQFHQKFSEQVGM